MRKQITTILAVVLILTAGAVLTAKLMVRADAHSAARWADVHVEWHKQRMARMDKSIRIYRAEADKQAAAESDLP